MPETGSHLDSKSPARILVVTPTLGASEFLERSVACVRALPLAIWHVIACPKSAIDSLRARFPEATVVEDAGKIGGIYGALNAALEAAPDAWDWFTYINDDDELAPGFGEVARAHFARKNPEPVVYGDVRVIDERGGTISVLTTEKNPRFIPAVLRAGISPLNQQGMLFHRDAVRSLGGFDTRYRLCADLDFWARAMAAGFAFRHYPLEVARFRMRPGQLSGDVGVTVREQAEIAARAFPEAGSRAMQALAKWRYRLCNLPRYLARVRRVGLASSNTILASGGSEET